MSASAVDDWQEVLSSCSQVATGLSNSTVLMLGDRACGKTELVARLKAVARHGGESSQHTGARSEVENVALGYTFVDLFADDLSGDVVARLNVWSLEG
jgi:hypothetical protein